MGSHEHSLIHSLVLRLTGIDFPDYLVMATAVVLFWTLLLLAVRSRFRVESPGSFQLVLEAVLGFVRGTLRDVVGPQGMRFVPMIGLFAIFVGTSNICGLIPGLQPPTDAYSVTVSLALISAIYYHLVGLQEHGLLRYLRHFGGPDMGKGLFALVFLVFFFLVELISHSARILSLSVRLFGNIFGEHTASGIFRNLVPLHTDRPLLLLIEIPGAILSPLPVMVLGVIGCLVQTFIFMMLSSIYLSMATEHEEGHDEHEHGHAGAHGAPETAVAQH